ncbi:MAG: tellurite resistance/C4-dicarboxylate transporter family protein [Propioniciclava sp.]
MSTGIQGRLARSIEGLTPGYFAVVMATGIISLGLKLNGDDALSWLMLYICAIAYGILVLLTIVRIIWYRAAMVDDFMDPRRAFGFFTFVAGTNVLGARLGAEGYYGATGVLLAVAGLAWLGLGYSVPWTAVLGHKERPAVNTANGTWFIWVVGSQSVAIGAATLEPVFEVMRRELAVLAITSWSVGVFLYGGAAVLVTMRLMLYPFGPQELNPPYWVSMGALAITVLAGARIVEMADAPMVAVTRDIIAGLAVVFWAFATWLIPVLIAAGWWRHFYHKMPLTYDATLWSMVFPLGMYGVAGIYLGRANNLPLVEAIGSTELWIAVAVWVTVFIAMLVNIVRTVLLPAPDPTSAA